MVGVVIIISKWPLKLPSQVLHWRTELLVPKMGTEKVGVVFYYAFSSQLALHSPLTYKSNFYPRIVPAKIIYLSKTQTCTSNNAR